MKVASVFLVAFAMLGNFCLQADHLLREDFSAPQSQWKHVHFRGDVRQEIDYVSEAGNRFVELRSGASGLTLDSFFQTLAVPEDAIKLEVSFSYRSRASRVPLLLAVSKARGCNIPSIKNNAVLKLDGQWHRMHLDFDLTGFGLKQVDLEFLLEGKVSTGDVLALDDISVRRKPMEPYEASLWRPTSQRLSGDDIAAVTLVSRSLDNRFELFLHNAEQKVVARKAISPFTGSQVCEFAFKAMALGQYQLSVQVNGQTVKSWPIWKISAKQDSLVIRKRTPYYRNKPFFTIGIYHVGDHVFDIVNKENQRTGNNQRYKRDDIFAALEKRHFNTVHYGWTVATPEYCRAAARHGLLVMSESRDRFSLIEKIKNEPNIWGWYSFDEPPVSLAAKCRQTYARYKEIDPYHPTATAFRSSGVGYGQEPLVDIAFANAYPIKAEKSSVELITTYLENCRKVLNRMSPTTCEIAVPQLFTHDSTMYNGVVPSTEQVRAEVYASLTAGAKGIFYYALYTHEPLQAGMELNPKRKHWFLPESRLWNEIGKLNGEIKALEQVYLRGIPVRSCSVIAKKSLNYRVWAYDNAAYVIVVNPSGTENVQAEIRWPEAYTKVDCFFGTQELSEMKQGKGKLYLKPYQVSVFSFHR